MLIESRRLPISQDCTTWIIRRRRPPMQTNEKVSVGVNGLFSYVPDEEKQ